MPRVLAALCLLCLTVPATAADAQPNIILLVADDAGFGDFSFQGSEQFPTPNIDRLASSGVRCTNGYVSGMVCSPTRAGLMTGRYQNRFGHEFNIPPTYSDTNGLPTTETTVADHLKKAGYRTIAIGKWHLGYAPHFHPLSRGFTDYHGFLQGSRSYWPIKGTQLNRLLEDRNPVEEDFKYMTDELGRATADYITSGDNRPYFAYVCFNAVHTPMQSLPEDEKPFSDIENKKRRTLAGMTKALDRAVGVILDAVEREGQTKNTLIAFISDNGGPENVNASDNGPLRGGKGTPYEGGIRVPFLISWPAKLPAGIEYDAPVIGLDFLPTFLAAAGKDTKSLNTGDRPIDGVNLLPYLTGEQTGRPHDILFWKNGNKKSVRAGDMKLVYDNGPKPMLFDLSKDIGEQTDLISEQPEAARRLNRALTQWEGELEEPRWGGTSKGRKSKPSDE